MAAPALADQPLSQLERLTQILGQNWEAEDPKKAFLIVRMFQIVKRALGEEFVARYIAWENSFNDCLSNHDIPEDAQKRSIVWSIDKYGRLALVLRLTHSGSHKVESHWLLQPELYNLKWVSYPIAWGRNLKASDELPFHSPVYPNDLDNLEKLLQGQAVGSYSLLRIPGDNGA